MTTRQEVLHDGATDERRTAQDEDSHAGNLGRDRCRSGDRGEPACYAVSGERADGKPGPGGVPPEAATTLPTTPGRTRR